MTKKPNYLPQAADPNWRSAPADTPQKRITPYARLLTKHEATQAELLDTRNRNDALLSEATAHEFRERDYLRRLGISSVIIQLQTELAVELSKPTRRWWQSPNSDVRNEYNVQRLQKHIFQAKNEMARGAPDASGSIQGLAARMGGPMKSDTEYHVGASQQYGTVAEAVKAAWAGEDTKGQAVYPGAGQHRGVNPDMVYKPGSDLVSDNRSASRAVNPANRKDGI